MLPFLPSIYRYLLSRAAATVTTSSSTTTTDATSPFIIVRILSSFCLFCQLNFFPPVLYMIQSLANYFLFFARISLDLYLKQYTQTETHDPGAVHVILAIWLIIISSSLVLLLLAALCSSTRASMFLKQTYFWFLYISFDD
jgi:predicted permease